MNSLIEPNIHPILVHFAYALSITSLVCYLMSSLWSTRRESLRAAADWMLAFGALAIVATIAAGFQAYYSVNHDAPSHAAMTIHRNWAVPSGTAILLLAGWRWLTRTKPVRTVFKLLLTAAALSLTVTAWWGGNIVYNYGLGVKSLPVVTGDGHDHEHGAISEPAKGDDMASTMTSGPQEAVGHDDSDGHHSAEKAANTHDNSDGHHDSEEADMSVNMGQKATPAALADQFGSALRAQDAATLKALFFPNAIIVEGGGAERSFAEYADHHMKADMAYTSAITTRMIKRDIVAGETLATVITQSEMVGNYKGKSVHNAMMETMTLRRSGERWKIAHIHWSSAPLSGADKPMPTADVPEGHDNSDGHHDDDE